MSRRNSFRRFQIGPGAASLIMILIVLSMSALGIFALFNARSDYQLSLRSADVTEQIYQLNEMAEDHVARLDAVLLSAAKQADSDETYLALVSESLPEDMTMEDRVISWEERLESGRVLSCAVTVNTLGSTERFTWSSHALYYDNEEMEYGF